MFHTNFHLGKIIVSGEKVKKNPLHTGLKKKVWVRVCSCSIACVLSCIVCVCVSSEQHQTDQQSQFNEPLLMGASANIKHAAQTV